MDNVFGERLKNVRKNSHMTQEMLANKCGVCSTAVRAWEKGLRLPNAYYLRGICTELHVSADYLLGMKTRKESGRRRGCGFDRCGLKCQ